MDLNPFKDLIRERSGLNFDDAGIAALENGIHIRMSEKGMELHAKYLNYLLHNQDEFNHLLNLLTINETYFFREPHHLNLLTERLIPEMLTRRKEGAKIKILSAGCSTGEEPYSLLISLMERYGAGVMNSFSVTGLDIDSNVIRKACEGIFTAYSFRGVSQQLMEKYFEPTGNNRHKIKDFVREGVKFRKFNLLNDDFPDELKGVDVIFYRNVSIYFEPETQKSIFKKLANLLNENGYLIVGATETMSHNFGVLLLVELDGMFLYQKGVGVGIGGRSLGVRPAETETRKYGDMGKQSLMREDSVRAQENRKIAKAEKILKQSAEIQNKKRTQPLFEEALSLARNKEYDKSLALIDEIMRNEPSFIKAYTLRAGILINLKRLQEAEDVCLKSIDIDKWCLESYLLLGLIARIQNDDEKAVKRFKEAMYIQSSCWLAHFYLADIFRSQRETERAIREYEITLKLLKKENIQEHGLTFFMLAFPVKQIAHLCNHNLEDLKRQLE